MHFGSLLGERVALGSARRSATLGVLLVLGDLAYRLLARRIAASNNRSACNNTRRLLTTPVFEIVEFAFHDTLGVARDSSHGLDLCAHVGDTQTRQHSVSRTWSCRACDAATVVRVCSSSGSMSLRVAITPARTKHVESQTCNASQ
jgi:hypothetical protein